MSVILYIYIYQLETTSNYTQQTPNVYGLNRVLTCAKSENALITPKTTTIDCLLVHCYTRAPRHSAIIAKNVYLQAFVRSTGVHMSYIQ